MNHLHFQVATGTIAVTWNSASQLSRVDWYDTVVSKKNIGSWGLFSRVGLSKEVEKALDELQDYFETGAPISPLSWDWLDRTGWSAFQEKVFRAILDIPHGETRNYAWVAKRTGSVSATRAVGQALRRNPLPIIIPCHRVVGSNGLGGFMGTADENQPEARLKRWLIENENQYRNPVLPFFDPQVFAPMPIRGLTPCQQYQTLMVI